MYMFLTVSTILIIITALVYHRKQQEIYRVPFTIKTDGPIYGVRFYSNPIRLMMIEEINEKIAFREFKERITQELWIKLQDEEPWNLDCENYDKIIKINMTKFRRELRGE